MDSEVETPGADTATADPEPAPLPPPPAQPAPAEGSVMQDFTFTDSVGRQQRLVEFAAGRPAVVNFWAPSSVFCVEQLAGLKEVHTAAGDTVALVSVSTEDAGIDQAAASGGYKWMFGKDVDGAQVYNVIGVPVTLFIDRKGVVRRRFDGSVDATDLLAALKEIK